MRFNNKMNVYNFNKNFETDKIIGEIYEKFTNKSSRNCLKGGGKY